MTRNIFDQTQEGQEKPGNWINSATEWIGLFGMFPVYAGLFQMLGQDESMKIYGIFWFFVGIMVEGGTMAIPGYIAAVYQQGKKYILNYVFYGSHGVLRHMEVIKPTLVVARLEDDDSISVLDETDNEYKKLTMPLGGEYMTDREVDKKYDEDRKITEAKEHKEISKKKKFAIIGVIVIAVALVLFFAKFVFFWI